MNNSIPINMMDELENPSFYLDKSFCLLFANRCARDLVPILCEPGAILERLTVNNQVRLNLEAQRNAIVPLYDVPSAYRLMMLIPIPSGYVVTLGASPYLPDYPLSFAEQLRDPLAEIFATLPLLSQHCEHIGDDAHLQRINRSCYQMLRSANILTSLSCIAKNETATEPVDCCSLVSTLCHTFSDVARPGLPPVSYSVPKQPLIVRGDPAMISAALENLLSNSLRFTRDGNKITVKLRAVGKHALLTVRDAGSGIRQEALHHVFDTYYSAPAYPDRPAPGLGLGLSFVHALVARMGGTVSLESNWGEGTSVSIALPLDESGEAGVESRASDYLTNRYSSLYTELYDFCVLPTV